MAKAKLGLKDLSVVENIQPARQIVVKSNSQPSAAPRPLNEQPRGDQEQRDCPGLTAGQRVWPVGAAGQGPWSDPATKIVPENPAKRYSLQMEQR